MIQISLRRLSFNSLSISVSVVEPSVTCLGVWLKQNGPIIYSGSTLFTIYVLCHHTRLISESA